MLKIAYELYLKHREEMICDFLRNALRNYSCKIKKNYLAFLQYRLVRMEQIKENIDKMTFSKDSTLDEKEQLQIKLFY